MTEMMTREEFEQELLRLMQHAIDVSHCYSIYQNGLLTANLKQEIARVSPALLQAHQTQWIACSDKLPDNRNIHLVARVYGNRTLGWYDGDIWYTGNNFGRDDLTVSHWMPLPSPPIQ
jgi:hypothetical protein